MSSDQNDRDHDDLDSEDENEEEIKSDAKENVQSNS